MGIFEQGKAEHYSSYGMLVMMRESWETLKKKLICHNLVTP